MLSPALCIHTYRSPYKWPRLRLHSFQRKRTHSQAEHEARVVAEAKIVLFSDAVHHLNNPLSHIQGSTDRVTGLAKQMRTSINELLHSEPIDPEAELVRKTYDTQFGEVLQSLGDADQASSRATDAVKLLRVVSGIDGPAMTTFSFKELSEVACRRRAPSVGARGSGPQPDERARS